MIALTDIEAKTYAALQEWVAQRSGPLTSDEVAYLLSFALDAVQSPCDTLWWCSFCDTDRPEGNQFLGVSIVPAPVDVLVAPTTVVLGCNPGGEMVFNLIPDHLAVHIPENQRGRILGKEEAAALDLLLSRKVLEQRKAD